MNDWELLQEYAQQHSETAFAALVERYVHLVYSAAFRQTNDRALAQDVVQAVFTLLAQKAASISRETILAGWFFRTTRNVALTAIRSERRRRHREALAMQVEEAVGSESEHWQELAPVLDEAVAELNEVDRNAVLLRFFRERSLSDVGQALGISEEAAKKRVARAIAKLRRFFTNRGIVLSGTALTGLLTSRVVQSAPASLIPSLLQSDFLKSGRTAPAMALLVNETLRELANGRAKAALVVAGAIGLSALLGVVAWQQGKATLNPANPPAALAPTATPQVGRERLATTLPPNPIASALPLRVVAMEDGRPLARAAVHILYRGNEDASIDLVTDSEGRCRIPLTGREFRSVYAIVDLAAYAPKSVTWFHYELGSQAQTEEYVLELERGRVFSGWVRDDSGQPVPGSKVTLRPVGDLANREELTSSVTTTDLEGRWTSDQIPARVDSVPTLVEHPDFARTEADLSLAGSPPKEPVFVLHQGVGVAGVVVSDSGLPIAGATVTDQPRATMVATTDTEGRFAFPHVPSGRVRLKALADGFPSAEEEIECATDVDDVRVVLRTSVSPETNARRPGPDYRIVRLEATVVDGQTGQPIDRFQVLQGRQSVVGGSPLESHGLEGEPEFLGESRAGALAWDWPLQAQLRQFKIEIRAAGYAPAVSDYIAADDQRHALHFRLQRDKSIAGQVVTPEGGLAAGAIVQLGGSDWLPTIEVAPQQPFGLRIYRVGPLAAQSATGTDGKFAVPRLAGADRLLVVHESGCGVFSLTNLGKERIRLQKWGRIEGQVRIGAAPGTNQSVQIGRCPADRGDLFIPFGGSARSDAEGQFAFDHVPPGVYQLFRVIRRIDTPSSPTVFSYNTGVEVKPGEVAPVTVGGTGRRIIGRLRPIPDDASVDWNSEFQVITHQEPASAPGEKRIAGAFPICFLHNYYLQIAADGTFVIEDVPPGNYRLMIRLTDPVEPSATADPNLRFRRPIGDFSRELAIPASEGKEDDQPVDLGVLPVEVKR